MTRKQILEAAEKCVDGDRNKRYGEPEDNFALIGAFWGAYLGRIIAPHDVAAMMALLKIARIRDSAGEDEDSWVDVAGYGACGGALISPVGGDYGD